MFLGTHTPRLDSKGRLFLPARFREELAEGLVLTRGQERCLYVWRPATFLQFVQRPGGSEDVANRDNRAFIRMLGAEGSQERPDGQGRITVPQRLREYAGLTRDCVVIGAVTRVEIWAPDAWQSYSAEQEPRFAEWSDPALPDPAGRG